MDYDQLHQDIPQLLVARGLLTQNQVTKILEYQCRLPPGQYMPFVQIVMDFGYLDEDQLKGVLGDAYEHAQDPVGQILVQQGLVSMEQLKQALEVLNTFPRNHVVDILIDMGFTSLAEVSQAISKHQLLQSRRLQTLAPVYQEPESPTPSELNTADGILSETETAAVSAGKNTVEQVAVHLPLGRQLIAQGYLTEDELRDAIEYQQRLPKVMYKPLGEILVLLGYINEAHLQEILLTQSQQHPRPKMGEVLIQSGLIEEWQLSHALSLQFSLPHAQKKLGTLLVELGYATRDEIEGVLSRFYQQEHRAPGHSLQVQHLEQPPSASSPAASSTPASVAPVPLGQVLIAKGYITESQLNDALLQQQQQSAHDYKPLGDILVLMGYLTEAQLQDALGEQPTFVREPLGQILIQQGLIEEWQLAHALCIQFETPEEGRQTLGIILTTLGYVSQPEIEAAILAHFRQR